MKIKPGLHRTGPFNVDAVRREAEEAGYTTFVLPQEGIVNRTSFFDAVRATFPLDPPLVGSHSWDALSDSLWQGLHSHSSRRIAILWSNSCAMSNSASADFATALEVLADVAVALGDRRATVDNPKEVAVLVE